MSRIGKLPITIPNDVKVEINDLNIKVTGPNGTLQKVFKGQININHDTINNQVMVTPLNNSRKAKEMWGTARSIINSCVKGVVQGYSTELEVNGVGYRASIKGKYLSLVLGKSHTTKIEIPEGLKIEIPKPSSVIVNSNNKEFLGAFISKIINERPPEPYKGKGIKIKGQFVQRKEGKKTK